MIGKISTVMYDDFVVLNSSDVRVSGLSVGNFTGTLYNPSNTESWAIIPGGVSITGLGGGSYRISYTPNAVGLWKLDVFNATYFPEGKCANHNIYTNDFDSIATAVWAVATRTLSTYGSLVADVATAVWASVSRTLTAFGFSVAVSDKTGFSLLATGADLILKSSTFIQAIVTAINEFATYGLTALNTLLVTTGIKAASIPAATLADDAITASKFDESTAYPLIALEKAAIIDTQTRAEFIYNIEGGRWKIEANQMIFYKPDNLTEIARFNLLDNAGAPAMTSIFQRVKV